MDRDYTLKPRVTPIISPLLETESRRRHYRELPGLETKIASKLDATWLLEGMSDPPGTRDEGLRFAPHYCPTESPTDDTWKLRSHVHVHRTTNEPQHSPPIPLLRRDENYSLEDDAENIWLKCWH